MVITSLLPSISRFADANSCSKSFLGLETWFHFLPAKDFNSDCSMTSFDALGTGSGFLLIAMAILDDLLRIAAYVAVGYVIYGGITYITSQGAPDQTKKAQQTIINALIGLATALIAAAIVSFIGNRLGS
ncbi:MAG TPA: hypothetical protein VLF59_06125 [Candidatus Saccharimonadales bacterium]|nr:hypothetical protein [Candidatus Saccharimonadales bacterium]